MSFNVAFIGLGVMGYPMAGYISKAGHNVTVYNRTALKLTNGLQNIKAQKQIHLQKLLRELTLFLPVLEMIMI
jgi:3-hydroxyisobutyrate dehydrogenase